MAQMFWTLTFFTLATASRNRCRTRAVVNVGLVGAAARHLASVIVNERSDHPFTKRSGDMVYTSVLD
jgi:hypothetical protein